MAEPQTRPQDGDSVSIYPEWGMDGTNEAAPTTGEKDDGYAVSALNISSSKINWLRNRVQQWAKWFRQKAIHYYDLMDAAGDYVVVDGKPPTIASLTTLSTYSEFWIDGSRVELGGELITVNDEKDTYYAVDDSSANEQNEVPIDDPPPTPSAGFVNVWRLKSTGGEITFTSTVIDSTPTLQNFTADTVTLSSATITGATIGTATLDNVLIRKDEQWSPEADGKFRSFRTHKGTTAENTRDMRDETFVGTSTLVEDYATADGFSYRTVVDVIGARNTDGLKVWSVTLIATFANDSGLSQIGTTTEVAKVDTTAADVTSVTLGISGAAIRIATVVSTGTYHWSIRRRIQRTTMAT